MATKQQEKQADETEKQGRQQMDAVIGKNVLHTLGQPNNLNRVQVRSLWSNYFRVNILVGPDISSLKIAHSFFLSADPAGNILSSTPTLSKLY